jgi:hypothetical protein
MLKSEKYILNTPVTVTMLQKEVEFEKLPQLECVAMASDPKNL